MGFSSWVASRQKPVLYSSIHRNEAPGAEQIRSFLSVPLVVAGECVGVLNLGRTEDGAYGPGSLRALILAGSMLAGLVQRHLARRRSFRPRSPSRSTGPAIHCPVCLCSSQIATRRSP